MHVEHHLNTYYYIFSSKFWEEEWIYFGCELVAGQSDEDNSNNSRSRADSHQIRFT